MSFCISSSNPRRFVIAVVALLATLLAFTLLLRQVLVATGDFLPEAEIVRLQQATTTPCIYSEYGKQNEALYKFELYRAIKPEIVVLGSSRVLAMNQREFSRPFVNLGRVMTDIKRGPSAVEELLKIHKPKFMLIGLDQYWFNPNWREAGVAKVKLTPSDPNDPRALLRLAGLIIREGMWGEVWRALWQGPECHIGVSAKRFQSGYARDGYRYYGELLTTSEPHQDRQFAMTLGRIAAGNRRFEKSASVSAEQLAYLTSLHANLTAADVDHLFYFPTFAPIVVKAMTADGGYGYIADLQRAITDADLPFAVTEDPAITDCDFIDGFHAGDAAQARQLAMLANANPTFASFINMDEITVLSAPGTPPTHYAEEELGLARKDYLELGCSWGK